MNKRVGHTSSIIRPQALGRLRPVSSTEGLWSDYLIGIINPFACITAYESPGFCFADFRRCFCLKKTHIFKVQVYTKDNAKRQNKVFSKSFT